MIEIPTNDSEATSPEDHFPCQSTQHQICTGLGIGPCRAPGIAIDSGNGQSGSSIVVLGDHHPSCFMEAWWPAYRKVPTRNVTNLQNASPSASPLTVHPECGRRAREDPGSTAGLPSDRTKLLSTPRKRNRRKLCFSKAVHSKAQIGVAPLLGAKPRRVARADEGIT